VTGPAVAADPLSTGWSALRAFFHDGVPKLEEALAAFAAAEADVRRSGDTSRLTLWLLGTTTALQYTRRPEAMDTALQRGRELVNVVGRDQGEPATIPYRTVVEAVYRDLADVVPAQAETTLAAGVEYSDRTVRLARRARRDEWLAAAQASRADLLVRRAGADRRAIRRAVKLYEDARPRWPARDVEGRAQAALRYGGALLAAGDAAKSAQVAREALATFVARGDRYHEAGAHLALARALFALDRDEALDEQAAAVSLYKTLKCRWELRRAEEALR
jgi:hypothetical protein